MPTVLSLVPCFGPSPVYPVERLDPTRIAWVNARVRAVALRNRGWVRLVDPTAQLCGLDGKTRERNDDGVEIRPDGAHFESDSADLVLEHLARRPARRRLHRPRLTATEAPVHDVAGRQAVQTPQRDWPKR